MMKRETKKHITTESHQFTRAVRAAATTISAVILSLSVGSAIAAEGGSGFYLLGQRSQNAAVLPPVEGVFFAMPTYYYSGDASSTKRLPEGAAITQGLDADITLLLPTVLWVTPAKFLGGTLAFSGTFVYGNADLKANTAVAIPGIVIGPFDTSDDRWATGDLAFSALLGWQGEHQHYLFAASVNAPTGNYDDRRLSNVSLNYWATDFTVAATWLNPDSNIELSGAAGITFNGENNDTDYQTGNESHLEAAAFYNFSTNFSAGVNGYHYQQLTGDSGDGAVLGNFKGRVSAFGPALAGSFQVGAVPVSANFSYYHEFNVKNRLKGDTAWLTLSMPLWVPGASQ